MMKETLDIEQSKSNFLKEHWFKLLVIAILVIVSIYMNVGWSRYYQLNSESLTEKHELYQDTLGHLQRENVAREAYYNALRKDYDSICNVLKMDSIEMKIKDDYYEKIYDSINSIPVDSLIKLFPITRDLP